MFFDPDDEFLGNGSMDTSAVERIGVLLIYFAILGLGYLWQHYHG